MFWGFVCWLSSFLPKLLFDLPFLFFFDATSKDTSELILAILWLGDKGIKGLNETKIFEIFNENLLAFLLRQISTVSYFE